MEIDINQKKISFGAGYSIHLNKDEKYFATRKFFSLRGEILLIEKSSEIVKYKIVRSRAWFKLSYNLIKNDKNQFELRTVSSWKIHYECQVGGNLYELFGHKRRKYSIYKNGEQLAWWDKQAVSWFSGDNYKMIVDDNSDYELLICFCLIIDNAKSRNSSGSTITFDLGNIGPEAKKFNNKWKPKN